MSMSHLIHTVTIAECLIFGAEKQVLESDCPALPRAVPPPIKISSKGVFCNPSSCCGRLRNSDSPAPSAKKIE